MEVGSWINLILHLYDEKSINIFINFVKIII